MISRQEAIEFLDNHIKSREILERSLKLGLIDAEGYSEVEVAGIKMSEKLIEVYGIEKLAKALGEKLDISKTIEYKNYTIMEM